MEAGVFPRHFWLQDENLELYQLHRRVNILILCSDTHSWPRTLSLWSLAMLVSQLENVTLWLQMKSHPAYIVVRKSELTQASEAETSPAYPGWQERVIVESTGWICRCSHIHKKLLHVGKTDFRYLEVCQIFVNSTFAPTKMKLY